MIRKKTLRFPESAVCQLFRHAEKGVVKMVFSLPQGFYGVLPDGIIWCEKCQTVFDGLADKHPVKGIFVDYRKFPEMKGVHTSQNKHGYLVIMNRFRDKYPWFYWKRQLAYLVFYANFPAGYAAEINAVCRISKGGCR
jgi:hypothetical protein